METRQHSVDIDSASAPNIERITTESVSLKFRPCLFLRMPPAIARLLATEMVTPDFETPAPCSGLPHFTGHAVQNDTSTVCSEWVARRKG